LAESGLDLMFTTKAPLKTDQKGEVSDRDRQGGILAAVD
jgi:hypothetical protein